MVCTYILYSEVSYKYYVGSSRESSAQVRLKSHNAGKVRSTKSARPWILVHEETFPTYTDARKRENILKSGQGREWIRERWQSGLLRQSCPPTAGPPKAEKLPSTSKS